jgi:hypothetical protein
MALRKKTGGRAKGTPNKTTLAVAERLEAIGCDPLERHGKDRDGHQHAHRSSLRTLWRIGAVHRAGAQGD